MSRHPRGWLAGLLLGAVVVAGCGGAAHSGGPGARSVATAGDRRANDFGAGVAFTGFHRLEQVLWSTHATAAAGVPVGTELLAALQRLQRTARAACYTPQDATLLATANQGGDELLAGLQHYAQSPGYDGSGYVRFTRLAVDARRQLTALVAAFAEPISLLTAATSP